VSGSGTNLARLDVHENNSGATLASADVAWNVFAEANRPHDVILLFTNAVPANPLEFRVYWNHVPGAPAFTITDVSLDGLVNWTAAQPHPRILVAWTASTLGKPTRLAILPRAIWVAGRARVRYRAGDYSAQFELKVDNFNWDNQPVASIYVVDTDSNLTLASQTLSRNQFPDVFYQTFALSFNVVAGHHYDFSDLLVL